MPDTPILDGDFGLNALFKTLLTVKKLCFESIVILNFLLNLLLSSICYMHFAISNPLNTVSVIII